MQKKNNAINVLKLLLYFLIAFGLNQVIQLSFPAWKIFPDFIYTAVWVFAYFNPGIWSLIFGIMAGFLHDGLFSPVIGLGIFIGMLTSIISSSFLQRIWQHRIGFLFVQTIFLQLTTKFLESIIVYSSFALRYGLPLTMNIVLNNFIRDLPLTFVLNTVAVALWLLIIKYVIPFSKFDPNSEYFDYSEKPKEVL